MPIPAILSAALAALRTAGSAVVGGGLEAGAFAGRAAITGARGGSFGEILASGTRGGAAGRAAQAAKAAAELANSNPTKVNIAAAKKAQTAADAAAKSQEKYASSIDTAKNATQGFIQTVPKVDSWFAGAASFVIKAAEPIRNLVAGSNPAVAERFALAVDDAYGVIGRFLIPVLDSATTAVRKVGDAYAGSERAFQPFVRALSLFFQRTGELVTDLIRKHGPAIEFLGTALEQMVGAASYAAESIIYLTGALNWFAKQAGFRPEFDKNASSFGAGSRNVRFVQAKTASDEAIKSALQSGAAQPKKAEEHLDKIAQNTTSILSAILAAAVRNDPTGLFTGIPKYLVGDGK